jgi:hypothetical protein
MRVKALGFTTRSQFKRQPDQVDHSLLERGARKRTAAMHGYSAPKIDNLSGAGTRFVSQKDVSKMKERQRQKIKEIGVVLCSADYVSLDEQARALGLCRSTTWVILQANHKSTGLTVGLITRMLQAPELPSAVRATVLQYAEDKAAGLYGHPDSVRQRFTVALDEVAPQIANRRRTTNPR